jgi:Metallopeptidase family M24
MIVDEVSVKRTRVQQIVRAHDAAGVRLTGAGTLAWLLDGARVAVPFAGPAVLCADVAAYGAVVVHALANEVDRLRAEELPAGIEVRSVPWFDPFTPPPAGYLDETDLDAELRTARAALLPGERARYAAFGAGAAAVVTDVLAAVRPHHTERAIAAELAGRLVGIGAEPMVLLVAGERRVGIPHPLPTDAPVGRRAMAAVGARRHGLVVNLTRWVSDAPDPEGEAALREVEADAFAATTPGRALSEVLADIAASYERNGFGADGWRRHHQGGPTGYLGRDPKVTPTTADRVVDGQAYAWNPSAPGVKLEDTVVIDGGRLEVLTADPRWPVVEMRGVPRPRALAMGSEEGT